MKYAAALAALAAAVSAQDLSSIPECAHECISNAMDEAGFGSDYQRACSEMESLITTAAPCVLGACDSPADVLTAVNEFCASLGDGSDDEATTTEAPATTESAVPTESAEPTVTEEPTETTGAPEPTTTDDADDEDEDDEDDAEGPSGSGSIVPPEPTETEEPGPEPTESEEPEPTDVPGAAAGVAKLSALGMLALGALAAF
ncbi:hypothetical protein VTK26DRAFT_3633 [Humicola hyalothermophila]